jgi:hypothetical protein
MSITSKAVAATLSLCALYATNAYATGENTTVPPQSISTNTTKTYSSSGGSTSSTSSGSSSGCDGGCWAYPAK